MNRNQALAGLSPYDHVIVDANHLGAFFCGETFRFVLDPRTRRAAEHVARWHGCTFEFHASTGTAAFIKRGRISGYAVTLFETLVLWVEHLSAASRAGIDRRRASPTEGGIATA
jgi:hypothetical protein